MLVYLRDVTPEWWFSTSSSGMSLLPQTRSLRQELEIYAIFTTSVGLLLQRLGRLHPKIGTHPKWICVLHQLGFQPATNDVLRPGLCCHTGQIGFLRLGLEPQKWKWNFDQNWNEATPTANGLTSGNQNLKVPRIGTTVVYQSGYHLPGEMTTTVEHRIQVGSPAEWNAISMDDGNPTNTRTPHSLKHRVGCHWLISKAER